MTRLTEYAPRAASALLCALALTACAPAPTPAPALPEAPSTTPSPGPTGTPLPAAAAVGPTAPQTPTAPVATPTTPAATPRPVCTPPLCAEGEVYHCPAECPGGCGTTCATATPTDEPEPWEQPVPVLAYTVEGDLWIAVGYNAPRRVSDSGMDSAPLFSPDGGLVLYRQQLFDDDPDRDRVEYRIVDVNSEDVRPLFVAPDDLQAADGVAGAEAPYARVPYQVAWLPDGRHIAFNTTNPGEYGLVTNDDLWLADTVEGGVTRLLADGEGGAFAHSPDGGSILVADDRSVALVSAGGGDRRQLLALDPYDTGSEWAYVPLPVWLPDGSAGLLALTSPDPSGAAPSCRLHRLDPVGGATVIGELPVHCVATSMRDRLWSPDRRRVAYLDDANGTLVVANADGSAPEVYTTRASEFVGWAPDSRRFVLRIDEAGYLYVGAMGVAPVLVGAPEEVGDVWDVRWFDGEAYAFLAGALDAPTLYVASVGGEPRVIAEDVTELDVALAR